MRIDRSSIVSSHLDYNPQEFPVLDRLIPSKVQDRMRPQTIEIFDAIHILNRQKGYPVARSLRDCFW